MLEQCYIGQEAGEEHWRTKGYDSKRVCEEDTRQKESGRERQYKKSIGDKTHRRRIQYNEKTYTKM